MCIGGCVCLWLYLWFCKQLNTFFLSFSLRFSEMFAYIGRNSHDDVFYEDDIWSGEDENGCVLNLF